jgi:predicted transposase YdaD
VQQGPGPRPFDVATRRLIEDDPAGWLAWIGLPPDGPIQPLETNLSTALAEVDKVLRVEGPTPWLAHLEVQSSHDPRLPSRVLQYHVLLRHRYECPVESTIVVLRPEAYGPELSGRLDQHGVTGERTISFWFRVVRLWERPVEELLQGGLGILPLAPIAAVERDRLPEIIRRIGERFEHEASPNDIGELWAATEILMGLRYDKDDARHLLRGVKGMRESSTYQAILEEGREEGREQGREQGRVTEGRQIVLELGTDKFGPPSATTVGTLEQIDDLAVLHRLARGILRTASWQELLATASGR